MRVEDWPRVRRLFEEALTVSAERRASWLADHAGAELAGEVWALLCADALRETVLDDPESLLGLAGPEGGDPAAEEAPPLESIGPFEVRGVLGEGRSGVVYRAWQPSPGREVALKLLRSSVWTATTGQRFQTEGRALGRLNHPGIARIYDLGELREPGGVRRPYLVMELVEGARLITEASEGRTLGERLTVLEELCAAVAHAHQRGVLHRDLKPGNVLVDQSGRVKVIDFGIARLMEDGPRATVSGQLLGTPAYMSPEQAAGQEADTRSDVHAVGLIARDVLRGDCRGDLAVVVAKATAREPDARYQSVGELGAEIGRVLAGRPIEARGPSPWYTVRMFVRRNRGLSAAVLVGAAGLLGGVVALAVSSERIAAANGEMRDGVSFVLDRVIVVLEDRIGTAAERRRLAADLLPWVDRMERRTADEESRLVRARLLRVLGDLDQGEGRFAEALAHQRRAAELRAALAAARPEDARRTAELSIAMVRVGDVLGDMDDTRGQFEQYTRAMEIDRRLAGEHPGDPKFESNLAYSCQRLGMFALRRGDIVTAERLVREQGAIAARLLEADPRNPVRLREDVEARGTLDEVLRASGRRHESAGAMDQAVEVAERLVRADPGSRRSSVMLMSMLHTAADGLGAEGDAARALEYSDRALRLAQMLNRSDPDDRDLAAWLVRILAGRALQLARLGRVDEEVRATEEAVRTMEWLEPRWEGGLEKATLWVTVLQARAVALQAAGRGAELAGPARRLSAELRARAQQGPEGDREQFQMLLTDAILLVPAPTEEERQEVRAILTRVSSGQDPRRLLNAAWRLRRAGDEPRARAVAQRVLEIAGPDQGLFVKQAREVLGDEPAGPAVP